MISKITDPVLEAHGVKLLVLREDITHPVMGGNKFRKLKYNLIKAREDRKTILVTFGGAYSNHIAATAYAGSVYGFRTIGIIRGEQPALLNNTLQRARNNGMELLFVSREKYREKEAMLPDLLKDYDEKSLYIIPEGGANTEGFRGCCEILENLNLNFQYVCCPCGTGTTLAGLAAAVRNGQKAIGFSVLKNNFSIEENVRLFLSEYKAEINCESSYRIFHDYHFGGYAKSTPALHDFIDDFKNISSIDIEPVYTGKMFYGIYDLVKKDFFKTGDTVLALHTGGLQYF